jgi:hypothetical protein
LFDWAGRKIAEETDMNLIRRNLQPGKYYLRVYKQGGTWQWLENKVQYELYGSTPTP